IAGLEAIGLGGFGCGRRRLLLRSGRSRGCWRSRRRCSDFVLRRRVGVVFVIVTLLFVFFFLFLICSFVRRLVIGGDFVFVGGLLFALVLIFIRRLRLGSIGICKEVPQAAAAVVAHFRAGVDAGEVKVFHVQLSVKKVHELDHEHSLIER